MWGFNPRECTRIRRVFVRFSPFVYCACLTAVLFFSSLRLAEEIYIFDSIIVILKVAHNGAIVTSKTFER